jgi:hypothetical protein
MDEVQETDNKQQTMQFPSLDGVDSGCSAEDDKTRLGGTVVQPGSTSSNNGRISSTTKEAASLEIGTDTDANKASSKTHGDLATHSEVTPDSEDGVVDDNAEGYRSIERFLHNVYGPWVYVAPYLA